MDILLMKVRTIKKKNQGYFEAIFFRYIMQVKMEVGLGAPSFMGEEKQDERRRVGLQSVAQTPEDGENHNYVLLWCSF